MWYTMKCQGGRKPGDLMNQIVNKTGARKTGRDLRRTSGN